MMMKYPFASQRVEEAYNLSDTIAREGLLLLRDMIFETAQGRPEIGSIEETLRWGQPAYLTPQTKAGTTLRLGVSKFARFALFVHCQSRLIPEYLSAYPMWDRVDGTRAVLFDHATEIDPLRHGWLIEQALTYRLRKKTASK